MSQFYDACSPTWVYSSLPASHFVWVLFEVVCEAHSGITATLNHSNNDNLVEKKSTLFIYSSLDDLEPVWWIPTEDLTIHPSIHPS